MNPSTMWNEPNADSTVVVIEAALPPVSTMLIWLVPCSGGGGGGAVGGPNSPGFAVPMVVPIGDECRPTRQVVAVDQGIGRPTRQGDEISVCDVLVAICVCQPLRFGYQVYPHHRGSASVQVEVGRLVIAHREVLEHTECRRDCDAAR